MVHFNAPIFEGMEKSQQQFGKSGQKEKTIPHTSLIQV
jgi:hypothetical protein